MTEREVVVVGPKWTRSTLDVVNNTYVVQNAMLFDYYPISVKPNLQVGNYLKFDISPGIMASGTAIIAKQLYDVSIRDLLRRQIDVRKRRIIDARPKPKTNAKPKTSDKLDGEANQTGNNQPGISELVRDEECKNADMAWQNQVDTLLTTLHQEEGEEWEVTSSTQPGSGDEGGSVQDMFEDT